MGRETRTTDAVRRERQLIATLGDRVALEAITWSTTTDDPDFIVQVISVLEVDPAGLLVADIIFDDESRADAFLEAHNRLVAGGMPQTPVAAYGLAFAARDWDDLRRGLSDDFVVRDHRSIGLFNLGADEWVASTRALVELVPDIGAQLTQVFSAADHGVLFGLRQLGTTADGTPFDRSFINLFRFGDAAIIGVELFDLEDLDRALARFYGLRPGSP